MNKDNLCTSFTPLQDSIMDKNKKKKVKSKKDRIPPLDIITEEMFSNKTMFMNHKIDPSALFKLAKTSSREEFEKDQLERA